MNEVKKFSAILPIPTEIILDQLGYQSAVGQLFRKQTPEEKAEAEAEHERLSAQAKAETAAFIAALDAIEEPAIQAVLRLHAPQGDGYYLSCHGCDPGDYAEGPAVWPCQTVEVIASHHGIDIPDNVYITKEPA